MGGKCCCGRKEETYPIRQRQSLAALRSKKGSVGYRSRGDDAEKFDKAFEINDLKAFVDLLTSTQLIEKFEERMHPWAEDPRTIGALAATQLAILASQADSQHPGLKEEILEAGAIPPLVQYLHSDQQDRVQTAVIALGFLTADCPSVADATYRARALPLLLKQLDNPICGMRSVAATTLRNICIDSEEARDKFMNLGGMYGLVQQLDPLPDPSLIQADVELEAIMNFQDFIEDEKGCVITKYALLAIEAGAEEKLRNLMSSSDEEVRSAAEESLSALATVKND
mmetsp:Transcript_150678/g.280961  ORF Transcript_150678/g.280961 Transcript_150678/m.280961 type:complete len:284 (-) Transcript_150678:71-922(-)